MTSGMSASSAASRRDGCPFPGRRGRAPARSCGGHGDRPAPRRRPHWGSAAAAGRPAAPSAAGPPIRMQPEVRPRRLAGRRRVPVERQMQGGERRPVVRQIGRKIDAVKMDDVDRKAPARSRNRLRAGAARPAWPRRRERHRRPGSRPGCRTPASLRRRPPPTGGRPRQGHGRGPTESARRRRRHRGRPVPADRQR